MFKISKLLLLSFFGIFLFWALLTPIFEFPDEQAHFGTVTFLMDQGRVPVGSEMDMTPEMYRTQELLGVLRDSRGNNQYTYHPEHRVEYSDSLYGPHEQEILDLNTPDLRSSYVATEAARYPVLYYGYSSIFTHLVDSSDLIARVFVTRLGNILISLLTLYFAYQLAMVVFDSQKTAIVLASLITLQPMFSFLSAGINSDNLHNLLFTVVLFSGASLVRSGWSLPLTLLGAAASMLDIYAKPQGILALPLLLLPFLILLIKKRNWRLLASILVVGFAVFLLGRTQFSRYLGVLSLRNPKGAVFSEFLSFSLNKLVSQNIVWYWGVFKWLGVVLPPIYWQVANRLVLVSALGLGIYFYKWFKGKKLGASPSIVLYLLFSVVFYSLAIYYFDWYYTRTVGYSIGVQARYLFPTLAAQLSLLILGITSFTSSDKWKKRLQVVILFVFLWLQLGGLWTLITSYYDASSLTTLITQASQYKPFFVKGYWWYFWIVAYLFALIGIVWTTCFSRGQIKKT